MAELKKEFIEGISRDTELLKTMGKTLYEATDKGIDGLEWDGLAFQRQCHYTNAAWKLLGVILESKWLN